LEGGKKMPKIDVYDIQGKKVSTVELNEQIFGITPNEAVVHSVIVNYMANQRQGTQSTKTRAEVSGGGRKPWRQKGTGRARQGSIRAPQWIKGGIALGPKPRDYRYTVNKKERQLAVKSVLSSKVIENELIVVDAIPFNEIKTKNMVSALTNLKVEGKTLIVLPEKNENVQRSARNIEGVKTSLVNTINAYDLLKYKKLILTLDAVKKIEEVYA
jgi:large subunit ribosomal protein L4